MINQTALAAIDIDDDDIKAIGKLLLNSKNTLEKCSIWLMDLYNENPEMAASGATPFLNMYGWILGGWIMTKSAIKAKAIIKNDPKNKFAIEKINTSTFFCKSYLPVANALESTIKFSYKSILNYS